MKSFFAVCCLAVLTQVATAGPIHTVVIPNTGTALSINVGAGRLLKIYDYVHDGADASTATLTKSSQTAKILQSMAIATVDQHRTFSVSGPATVSIGVPATGNVTITFQLVDNTD